MKKPLFFCDNCGTQVDHGLRTCPGCGRFFSSVRCPACGLSGEDKLFTSGCPSCGYSAPSHRDKMKSQLRKSKTHHIPAGPLPLWVYVFSALALLVMIIALALVLR